MPPQERTEILDILKRTGAVVRDEHFVYTSGRHGPDYLNKDAVYPHTQEASRVGLLMAKQCRDSNPQVVVGPAFGGIILSQWTAHHLTQLLGEEVLGGFTEKAGDDKQIFNREYDKLVRGKRVLVVEDLTTTGGSVMKVIDSVREAGGTVVMVCVMVNRDPERVNEESVGAPFIALGVLHAESFDENECPLCKQGIPINTSVGHGKKYLEQKREKPL